MITDDDILQLHPRLYSYVVTRAESFGGYIFNPYRLTPIPVNALGARIIELSDGTKTVLDIINILCDEFETTLDIIKETTIDALKTLSGEYSINWKSERTDHPITADFKTSTSLSRSHLSAPASILWDITYACNLSCKQCLSSAGRPLDDELILDEIKEILDDLAKLKVFNICFLGGEPLMREDFIEILRYASQYNFGLSFSTNGVLIDDQMLEDLEDLKVFQVQVSLDGLEETHNQIRGLPNSFQLAVEAIKRLIGSGIQVGISTTVNKQNLTELEDLIQLSLSLGASYFKPIPIMPVGRGKDVNQLMLSPSETEQYVKFLLSKKNQYENELHIFAEETYSWLFHEPPEPHSFSTKLTHSTCAAGTSQLVFSSNGKVYPCPFLHDFVAGDLKSESIQQIWENSRVLRQFREVTTTDLKGKCKQCPYIPFRCRGGCRAAAYALTGDFYAEDPMCWYKPPS
ncbi:MAG: radical SAM protein [Candidatus Thorarchaeota archaeon]